RPPQPSPRSRRAPTRRSRRRVIRRCRRRGPRARPRAGRLSFPDFRARRSRPRLAHGRGKAVSRNEGKETMSSRSRLRRCAAYAVGTLAAPWLHAQHVLEEVRVVGTPHDRSPTEIAQSISVLAGHTLRRSLGNTLGETLAGELGVSSTYFGPGASRPVIRGLAGARVKVMEDGIDALDVASVSVDHAV